MLDVNNLTYLQCYLCFLSYKVRYSLCEWTFSWTIRLMEIHSRMANSDYKQLTENMHDTIAEILGRYIVISTIRKWFNSNILLQHSRI